MKSVTKSATRYTVFFLISLLFFTNIVFVAASEYGEDEAYLGQIVDDYENDDNIAAAFNVIHNETLDCMELNFTFGVSARDYTSFVEVDVPANRITFPNTTCVRHVSSRSEITYLYEDSGVDAWYEYDVYFDVFIDSEQRYARGIPFMISNNIGNQAAHYSGFWHHNVVWIYRSSATASNRYIALTWYGGGAPPLSGTQFKLNYPLDQWLYFRVRQNSTHLACWIYNDVEMSSRWAYFELSVEPKGFRYVYGVSGYTPGAAAYIDYYVKNFTTGGSGGYVEDGHYYTVEMLEGDTALSLMYNVTIPEDTGMTMEFSEDNVTWVNHNDQAGSDTLITGFESLDLRDLNTSTIYSRVNMTSNGLDTARIYQLRLVTITDVELGDGEGAAARPEGWVLTIMIVAVGLTLIILGTRRRR